MIRNILNMFGIVAAMSPCLLAANEPTMEPSTYQQIAACLFVGGQPVAGENVYFQTTVNTGSGYHSHYAERPKGSFYTWTGNESGQAATGFDGCAYIYWYAPQASGGHDILATSTIGGSTSIHIMVWTNSSAAMLELAASADYQLVGSTGDHPYNHFGTSTAISGIQSMMADFRQMTGVVAQVNDMSLGWGGTFDLGPA